MQIPIEVLIRQLGAGELRATAAALRDNAQAAQQASAANRALGLSAQQVAQLANATPAQRERIMAAYQREAMAAQQAARATEDLGQKAARGTGYAATFSNSWYQASRAMSTVGLVAAGAGAAILGAITPAIIAAAKYEQQLTMIANLTQSSTRDVAMYSEKIKDMATALGKSPEELAKALYFITSNGIEGAQALDVLTASAKASAIGLGETDVIARAVTAAINAWGAENLSAARATEILTSMVKYGAAEASEYAGTLGRVISLAATMGISFEEVGASIATFTKLGVSAAEAVTGLRGTLAVIEKGFKSGNKELEAYGTSYAKLRQEIREKGLAQTLIDLIQLFHGNEAALAKIFPNIRALAEVLSNARQQAGTYKMALEGIKTEHGNVDKAFLRTKQTAVQQWNEIKAAIQVALINLGEAALPTVKQILAQLKPLGQAVIDLTHRFNELPEPVKRWTVIGVAAIGVLLTTMGALLLTLGAVARAIGAIQMLELGSAVAGWTGAFGGVSAIVDVAVLSLGAFLIAFAKIAAAFAVGWAIGTMIRDLTGLGTYLDSLADKMTGLTELERQVAAQNVAVTDPRNKGKTLAERLPANEVMSHWTVEERAAYDSFIKQQKYLDGLSKAARDGAGVQVLASKSVEKAHHELTEAEKKAEEAYRSFVKSLHGDLGPALGMMTRYLREMGDVSKMGTGQLERLQKKIMELAKDGAPGLRDALHRVNEELSNRFLVDEYFRQFVSGAEAAKRATQEVNDILLSRQHKEEQREMLPGPAQPSAFGMHLAEERQAILNARNLRDEQLKINDALFKTGTIGRQTWEENRRGILGTQRVLMDWSRALSAINEILSALSKNTGTFLYGLVQAGAGVIGVLQSLQQYHEVQREAAKMTEQGDATGAAQLTRNYKIAASFQALAAAVQIYTRAQQARTSADVANATISGAATGAQAGAAFGGYGAIIGAVIGGAIGFFTSSSAKARWEAAGQEIAGALGHGVSEKLHEQIEATAKQYGIGLAQAALLNLDKAMAESGQSATYFLPAVKALFAGVKDGSIPAKQGVEQIGKAFSAMAKEAEDAGGLASKAMLDIIAESQRTGVHVKEVAEYVQTQVKAGGEGLAAMFEYLGMSGNATQEDFDRLGRSSLAFIDAMKAQGFTMLEIFDAIGPALDKAIEAAQKAGVDIGGAFGDLLHFRALIEDNKELVAAVEGTAGVIKALYNVGKLGGQNLHDMLTQNEKDYQALRDAGFSNVEALSLQADTYRYLNKLYKEGKIHLDEQTLAHIRDAEAAGLLDPTPQEQMKAVLDLQLQVLVAIAQMFHATLPAAVQEYIDSLNRIPTPPSPPGGAPPPPVPPPGGEPAAAGGAIVDPRPGGEMYRVGEGGQREVIAPVAAFMNDLRGAIVADVTAALRGRNGLAPDQPIVLQVNLRLPGERLIQWMERAQVAQALRVHPDAVTEFG